MANTNTDLTEEDAADLQFPKETDSPTTSSIEKELFSHSETIYKSHNVSLNDSSNSDTSIYEPLTTYCGNCSCELEPPYILCDICNITICCECFANGAEFLVHKNNHDYRVLSHNFVLFENSDWKASEELTLLDSITAYGNWNLVAQQLPNRNVNEIIGHYDYFYLQGNGAINMPKFPEREAAVFPSLVVPYRFRLTDIHEPPRYDYNSIGYQSLAGYNPARADFESDYDMNAEDLLSSLQEPEKDDPYREVIEKLQCAIIENYNRRLRERMRWKMIIREHGLILLRKTVSWLHRYDMTITKPVYEKLVRFMQFCNPDKFLMIMEGLHRSGELRIQISRLIQLRRKGIKSLADAKLYFKLQNLHENYKKELKLFRSLPQFQCNQYKESTMALLPKLAKRRTSFAPIEIVGMPGFEKLSNSERDLCSTIRLVPITYMELKEILIAENNKMGHLKLQTARRLLKIDVNKTRRLYDFLVAEGFINKPT